MSRRVAKSRELRAELVEAGARFLRTDGDHHWFALPDGQRVCLPMGGGHSDSSPGVAVKIRRAIERSRAGTIFSEEKVQCMKKELARA